MPKIIDEEAVFKAVLDTLVKLGYDHATTKALAAAAGMHEATLFRKYGSKVQLIERAVDYLLSNAPVSQMTYSGDLNADLLAFVEAYIETSDAYGEIIPIIMLELPRHPELAGSLQAPTQNLESMMAILGRYQADGHLKPEPLFNTMSALLGPIMISQMMRHANQPLSAPKVDAQAYIDAFLNGRAP